jgi:hypothetical protein
MSDLRNKALELINAYDDREALSKIEKLLGLERATLHQIASQLEVPVHKLKYLYTRNCQLAVQKQKRISAKQAEAIEGRKIISERNKFEI